MLLRFSAGTGSRPACKEFDTHGVMDVGLKL